MVCSLYELSAQAAIRNLDILKDSVKYLHKKALYMLLKVSLTKPEKALAFSFLIKNWPYSTFSVEAIHAKLSEDYYILLVYLIRRKKVGELDYIDLLHPTCSSRITDAVLDIILSNPSNIEAIDYDYGSFDTSEDFEQNTVLLTEPHHTLTIRMEIVVGSNVNNVITVLKMQDEALFFKLSVAQLCFRHSSGSDIAKVLHVTNVDNLTGVDLSYNSNNNLNYTSNNNLSYNSNNNGSRLRLVCSQLARFVNLQKVRFACNTIDSSLCPILTECFKSLNKLAYLDLSCSRLGESLVDLLRIGIKSENITVLILSGCSVTNTVITTLIESVKFKNLRKLKLDQNSELFKQKNSFVKLLNHLKNSLYYLDISNCQISKEDLLSICPDLNQCIHLYCLVIWPNQGVDLEFVTFEVLPLLQNLTHLKEVPPIEDVTKFL